MLAHEGVDAHPEQVGDSRQGGDWWSALTGAFTDADQSQDDHHGERCKKQNKRRLIKEHTGTVITGEQHIKGSDPETILLSNPKPLFLSSSAQFPLYHSATVKEINTLIQRLTRCV